MSASQTKPLPWAAIDMGSNSFRLEIGHVIRGRYKRELYLKDIVRLGAGLDAQGMLTDAAAERGLAALASFAEHLRDFPPERIRAVATQTLREARNRNDFLIKAQTALGHPIEVIAGREEARLIFAGVSRLQPSPKRRLVIDIGGRSTEMILGHGTHPERAESFQIGSVSLTMRFFADGKLTAEAFRAAQIAAGAELEEALNLFPAGAWEEALGASGTVGAVSQVLQSAGLTDGRITPAALAWCIEHCIQAGDISRLDLPGLKDDRRLVLAGGLCVLYTLLTQFGIQELQASKGALRQGVIFDLSERHGARASELRSHTVADLQQRFAVDTAHAQRVSDKAERLYRQLHPTPAPELLRELRWAAAIHEVGMVVSHHDHHRHSAYLIGHVDAPGFSQNQLQRLANLALGQRGRLRKLEPALADETLLWQLLALRLAVIVCHSRQARHAQGLKLVRQERRVTLAWPKGWRADQARTIFLLKEEVEAWRRNGAIELTIV